MLHARKVLMLVENRPAPDDARVWPEALALRDLGLEVIIISPKGADDYREAYCCLDGIHIYRYVLPSGHTVAAYVAEYAIALFKTFWLTLKVWRHHGLDVVHTANPPDIFFPIGWLLHVFGKKNVFDQHDLAPELFEVLFLEGRGPRRMAMFLHKLLLFCERCTYRVADLVIVTNQSFRQIATGRGKCPPQKVVVVRNGPDLSSMQPMVPELGLKLGKRYLLVYLGVMGPQDGVDYALRALHSLVYQHEHRDVALALLGDGTHVPALRALVHELELDDYVHFAGWVGRDAITRYLGAADVCLSPDPYNALNDVSTMIKTMEYMAAGKPVVAFDLTETRHTAQDSALYAIPNRVEDFADKVAVLLHDESLRLRMGAVGRKRIVEALNWEHCKGALVSAYGYLLGMSADQLLASAAVPEISTEDLSPVAREG